MGIEIALGASNFASVVALGVFLWRVFGARFDSVDARLDEYVARLGNIDSRLGKVDGRLGVIEARVASLEVRFDSLEGRLVSLEGRFDSLEGRFDGFGADHHSLARELSEFRGEMRGRLEMAFPRAVAES